MQTAVGTGISIHSDRSEKLSHTFFCGGLSTCSFSPPVLASSFFICRLCHNIDGLMLSGGGGMDPSPTTERNVSGIKLVASQPLSLRFEDHDSRKSLQDERNKYNSRGDHEEPKDRSPS